MLQGLLIRKPVNIKKLITEADCAEPGATWGGEGCVGDRRIKEIQKERKNGIAERHKGRKEGRPNTIGRKKRKTNIKQETKQFPRERKEERNE